MHACAQARIHTLGGHTSLCQGHVTLDPRPSGAQIFDPRFSTLGPLNPWPRPCALQICSHDTRHAYGHVHRHACRRVHKQCVETCARCARTCAQSPIDISKSPRRTSPRKVHAPLDPRRPRPSTLESRPSELSTLPTLLSRDCAPSTLDSRRSPR